MRKIRIGNDIQVSWEVKTNGEAVSLEGRTLKLYVRSAYEKKEIENFTVSGCVISFVYPASMQRSTGARALVLNDATEGAAEKTICADQAFTLVAHTCEESDDDVDFEDFMVSLQSNVLVGLPGMSAYELWLADGHTGSIEDYYEFLRQPASDFVTTVSAAEVERVKNEAARQEAEKKREAQNEECKKQTERAKNQADHPNIIGEDGYWMKWDEETGEYVRTPYYSKGTVDFPTFEVDTDEMELTVNITDGSEDRFELTDDGELVINMNY